MVIFFGTLTYAKNRGFIHAVIQRQTLAKCVSGVTDPPVIAAVGWNYGRSCEACRAVVNALASYVDRRAREFAHRN